MTSLSSTKAPTSHVLQLSPPIVSMASSPQMFSHPMRSRPSPIHMSSPCLSPGGRKQGETPLEGKCSADSPTVRFRQFCGQMHRISGLPTQLKNRLFCPLADGVSSDSSYRGNSCTVAVKEPQGNQLETERPRGGLSKMSASSVKRYSTSACGSYDASNSDVICVINSDGTITENKLAPRKAAPDPGSEGPAAEDGHWATSSDTPLPGTQSRTEQPGMFTFSGSACRIPTPFVPMHLASECTPPLGAMGLPSSVPEQEHFRKILNYLSTKAKNPDYDEEERCESVDQLTEWCETLFSLCVDLTAVAATPTAAAFRSSNCMEAAQNPQTPLFLPFEIVSADNFSIGPMEMSGVSALHDVDRSTSNVLFGDPSRLPVPRISVANSVSNSAGGAVNDYGALISGTNGSILTARSSIANYFGSSSAHNMSLAQISHMFARTQRHMLLDDGGLEMINQYVVIAEIGRGSTATVFLVLDSQTDKPYAIKAMSRPRERKRLLRRGPSVSINEPLPLAKDSQRGSNVPTSPSAESPSEKRGSESITQTRACAALAAKIDSRPSMETMTEKRLAELSPVEREIRVMRRLTHPGIARLYEVIDDEEDNMIMLVLDYLPNGPLARVKPYNPETDIAECSVVRPLSKLAIIARQVCAALRYMHHRRIVHNDIKPENLLLNAQSDIVITDFGKSVLLPRALQRPSRRGMSSSTAGPCLANADLSMASAADLNVFANTSMALAEGVGDDGRIKADVGVVGTPAFLAPELAEWNECSRETDIWAFGVTLYAILLGRLPFAAASVRETVAMITSNPPLAFPPLADVPQNEDLTEELYEDWKGLCASLLHSVPERRMSLKAFLSHPLIVSTMSGSQRRSDRVRSVPAVTRTTAKVVVVPHSVSLSGSRSMLEEYGNNSPIPWKSRDSGASRVEDAAAATGGPLQAKSRAGLAPLGPISDLSPFTCNTAEKPATLSFAKESGASGVNYSEISVSSKSSGTKNDAHCQTATFSSDEDYEGDDDGEGHRGSRKVYVKGTTARRFERVLQDPLASGMCTPLLAANGEPAVVPTASKQRRVSLGGEAVLHPRPPVSPTHRKELKPEALGSGAAKAEVTRVNPRPEGTYVLQSAHAQNSARPPAEAAISRRAKHGSPCGTMSRKSSSGASATSHHLSNLVTRRPLVAPKGDVPPGGRGPKRHSKSTRLGHLYSTSAARSGTKLGQKKHRSTGWHGDTVGKEPESDGSSHSSAWYSSPKLQAGNETISPSAVPPTRSSGLQRQIHPQVVPGIPDVASTAVLSVPNGGLRDVMRPPPLADGADASKRHSQGSEGSSHPAMVGSAEGVDRTDAAKPRTSVHFSNAVDAPDGDVSCSSYAMSLLSPLVRHSRLKSTALSGLDEPQFGTAFFFNRIDGGEDEQIFLPPLVHLEHVDGMSVSLEDPATTTESESATVTTEEEGDEEETEEDRTIDGKDSHMNRRVLRMAFVSHRRKEELRERAQVLLKNSHTGTAGMCYSPDRLSESRFAGLSGCFHRMSGHDSYGSNKKSAATFSGCSSSERRRLSSAPPLIGQPTGEGGPMLQSHRASSGSEPSGKS